VLAGWVLQAGADIMKAGSQTKRLFLYVEVAFLYFTSATVSAVSSSSLVT
jgi:hypothetical protein